MVVRERSASPSLQAPDVPSSGAAPRGRRALFAVLAAVATIGLALGALELLS